MPVTPPTDAQDRTAPELAPTASAVSRAGAFIRRPFRHPGPSRSRSSRWRSSSTRPRGRWSSASPPPRSRTRPGSSTGRRARASSWNQHPGVGAEPPPARRGPELLLPVRPLDGDAALLHLALPAPQAGGPYVRNAFLAANGIALVIFMLYPVASAPGRPGLRGHPDQGQRHRPPRRGLLRLVQPRCRRAVVHFGYAS